MALKPLHDRILVRRNEEEEQQQGGIIIPDTAKEKPQEAKVLAVGSGRDRRHFAARHSRVSPDQAGAFRRNLSC